MTVKELRQKLSGVDDNTNVVVHWEQDDRSDFLGIHDVSVSRGTPKRVNGKPGFEFDGKGPATWLFIHVDEE